MEKKKLLMAACSILLVIVLTGLLCPARGAALTPIKLRLHSYAPQPPSASGIGVKYIIDEITKRTKGAVTFEEYWGGALAPPSGQLHLVQMGAVDIEKTCTLYFPGKFIISHFEYSFPFNPVDPMLVTKAKRQIYREFPEKAEEYKKFNTVMLANHVCPYYELVSRTPIRSLDDLKGKKIAMVGRWFGKWMEPVGIVPVIMPAGDRYVNLQNGVIDADLLWLDLQFSLSLYEQAKHMIFVGFGSFVAEDVMMNLDSFRKLSPEIQRIFLEVGEESETYVAKVLEQRKNEVLEKLKKAGVTFIDFPEADKNIWASKIPDTPAEWAAEATAGGAPGWQIAKRWQEITAGMGHKWPRQWGVKK